MRKPAKKLKASLCHNICKFPSTEKNEGGGRAILTQSILEKDYCYHLEFDQTVANYYPQPITIDVVYDDGEEHSYTPDFEVCYRNGEKAYIEVKPAKYIGDPEYQMLLGYVSQKVAKNGMALRHVDECFIRREPLLTNLKRLFRFRSKFSPDRMLFDDQKNNISGHSSFSSLLKNTDETVTTQKLYIWIAHGYLKFDLDNEQLTGATVVEVNEV